FRALLSLLLLCSPGAFAARPLELEVFEDKAATLTADEVAAKLESWPWRPAPGPVASFGFSASRFWFRFRIDESGFVQGRNNPLLLEIPNANIERLGFYVAEGGRISERLAAGMGVTVE